ncbi:MAG: hypothetical protein QF664_12025 [Dehalococcoidia bacterium]|jgi:hypothetical protein|nr:hypothetical protein [Dehalococcoidia bacterium]
MFVLAIHHRVEDYERWKSVFDEFPPREGGAVFHRINRLVDDANTIAVVSGFLTADGAYAFVNNPDLGAAMQRAGVDGVPRIELYEEIEAVEY